MKLKLFIASLILLVLVLVPLSAQETPASTPFLFTNTPTRSSTDVAVATIEPSGEVERVVVDLPERVTFDGQRFQIVGFEFERSAHRMGSVSLTVKNISDMPASGQVWYLLAPPDATEPWNQAVYAVDAQAIIDLTADETRTFEFAAPPTEVIGEFRVSAWVHQTEADGTSVHSDGVGYEQTLTLAPSVYLNIEHVDFLTAETGETILFVTLNIRNFTDALTEVAYSFTLAAPDDPTPWETGVFVLPFQPLMLMPNQAIQVTTRSIVTLTGAELQVIGWLQERSDGEMQFRNNDPYP